MVDSNVEEVVRKLIELPGAYQLVQDILIDDSVSTVFQPRAEFLASISTPDPVTEIIASFLEEISIPNAEIEQIDSSNQHRFAGDTYDIYFYSLPPANIELPQSSVLLISLETEDFWELETIRDMILEADFSDLFRDFIPIWDSSGALRSWKSYLSLHLTENLLRKLILSRVMCDSDRLWWDKRIKPAAGGRYSIYKKSERNSADITKYDDEVMPDIFFTDLSALEKVISQPKNWEDIFQNVFRTKKYISRLGFLNRLRRKIAHNRYLTERNLNDLNDLKNQFNQVFRRVWDK